MKIRNIFWGIFLTAGFLYPLLGATHPALAAIYFVDATKGNDSNSGLSENAPWKTISKVNNTSFAPGDIILFKRGEIWRENLNPRSSGSPANPILFDAYGSGPLPKIFGSDSRSGSQSWVQESNSIWYTPNVTWEPKMLFHDGVGSQRKATKSSLSSNWDWWYDSSQGRVYCYLPHNPGQYAVELSRRDGIGFAYAHYITIKNLEIAYANFGIAFWGGSNWVIDNVYIHDVAVNGIHGNNQARNITIQNSVIDDWNWNGYRKPFGAGEAFMGYGIQVISSTANESDNWIIKNNKLRIINMQSGEDSTAINIDQQGHASHITGNIIIGKNRTGGGIMVWRPKGRSLITISGNIIQDTAHIGVNLSEFDKNNFTAGVLFERNILINSCTADIFDQEALRIWTSNTAPVIVRNNLINGTTPGVNSHHGIRIRHSNGVKVSNNTLYGTDIGLSIESQSSNILVRNNISSSHRKYSFFLDPTSSCMEDHNIYHGQTYGFVLSQTSKLADPKFVDPSTGNFFLQTSSPAINAGAAMPDAQTDLAGIVRPHGDGWDIGAFEYTSLTPPKNLRLVGN